MRFCHCCKVFSYSYWRRTGFDVLGVTAAERVRATFHVEFKTQYLVYYDLYVTYSSKLFVPTPALRALMGALHQYSKGLQAIMELNQTSSPTLFAISLPNLSWSSPRLIVAHLPRWNYPL